MNKSCTIPNIVAHMSDTTHESTGIFTNSADPSIKITSKIRGGDSNNQTSTSDDLESPLLSPAVTVNESMDQTCSRLNIIDGYVDTIGVPSSGSTDISKTPMDGDVDFVSSQGL